MCVCVCVFDSHDGEQYCGSALNIDCLLVALRRSGRSDSVSECVCVCVIHDLCVCVSTRVYVVLFPVSVYASVCVCVCVKVFLSNQCVTPFSIFIPDLFSFIFVFCNCILILKFEKLPLQIRSLEFST